MKRDHSPHENTIANRRIHFDLNRHLAICLIFETSRKVRCILRFQLACFLAAVRSSIYILEFFGFGVGPPTASNTALIDKVLQYSFEMIACLIDKCFIIMRGQIFQKVIAHITDRCLLLVQLDTHMAHDIGVTLC